MMNAVCWRISYIGDLSSRSLVSGTVSTRRLEYLLELEYRTDNHVFYFGIFLVYMRKVKFTQDLFDMKLGGILSEFPILDVSLAPNSGLPSSGSDSPYQIVYVSLDIELLAETQSLALDAVSRTSTPSSPPSSTFFTTRTITSSPSVSLTLLDT